MNSDGNGASGETSRRKAADAGTDSDTISRGLAAVQELTGENDEELALISSGW
jgi:hypothetical protein